ncbi:MAG: hypothetical protein DWI62_01605 [Chloroflexi bacterium]|nr:MAG: hypothetical protein DWI62_01605 [Chloroflexota bacterium]
MAIQPATPYATAPASAQPVVTAAGGDKDNFMQMLLTQLRYQDPMNPMKDSDFMSQISQLQMADKMSQLNKSMLESVRAETLSQAANFIGRRVHATQNGESVEGVVSSVQQRNGAVTLSVGGRIVTLPEIERIDTDNAKDSATPAVPAL